MDVWSFFLFTVSLVHLPSGFQLVYVNIAYTEVLMSKAISENALFGNTTLLFTDYIIHNNLFKAS